MNKRHYEHTLPNIRGSLSNTYKRLFKIFFIFIVLSDYGGLAAPIWFVTGREERLPAP